jgi:PIN domain nuclease of toxin-antitoxin system
MALLNAEKEAVLVQDLLPAAVVFDVNWWEDLTRLCVYGMPENKIQDSLAPLGLKAVPIDEEQASQAVAVISISAPLWPFSRRAGVSYPHSNRRSNRCHC